jgi:hypothetical protein
MKKTKSRLDFSCAEQVSHMASFMGLKWISLSHFFLIFFLFLRRWSWIALLGIA